MPPIGGFGKPERKRAKAKAKVKKVFTPTPDQQDRSRAGQLARSKRAAGDAPQDRAKDTKRADKHKQTQGYIDKVQASRGDRHPQGKAKGRAAQQLIDAAYFERARRVPTGEAKAGPHSVSATKKVKDQPRTDSEIRKYLVNGKAVYSTPIVHSTPDQRDRSKANRDAQLAGSKPKAGDAPQARESDSAKAGSYNKAHPVRTAQQEHRDNVTKAMKAKHTQYAGPPGGKVLEKIGYEIGKGGKHATLKTLEVTGRPSHAVAGAADEAVKGHSVGKVLKEAGKGLEGKQTTNFARVLKDSKVLRSHNTLRNVVGFGLDVGTDPTTYLTFGASSVLRKGAEDAARTARLAARKAGKSVEEQETAAKAAHDAHMATSKDPTNKGIQGGVRVPFSGKKLVTSGRTTAKLNRRLGGSKAATTFRNRARVQRTGRALDPDFRPGDVPESVHKAGRQAARRHRAHNDREQEKAENLRTSIERATGKGKKGEQRRKDITAEAERAPDRGSIPQTHVQLENTPRHEARIARGEAGRAREKARRGYAEAKGRAVNEDRHAVSERVMAPERAARDARDTAQRHLKTSAKQAKNAERAVRKVVLEHDADYQKAAAELRDLQRERATWRTRYGNEARSNNPRLNDDSVLSARASVLEDLDKRVAAAQAKVKAAAQAAEHKPIPKQAAKRADRAIHAGSKERDATRAANDASDVADIIRKDRPNRREFEENRGVPGPHLDNLQDKLGALKHAEGEVHAADARIKATAATPKTKELVRRVVGGFNNGPAPQQGNLLTGPRYADIRDSLPKQHSADTDIVDNLRARNQRIGATELKRGKLNPNQTLTDDALARHRAGTLDIADVKPSDIRDDYMHHELPEVISPVRTSGEARKKIKEVDQAINDVSNQLTSTIPRSAQAHRLSTELERLQHQRADLDRLRTGMSPTAPTSAAKGASQSSRRERTIRHSASEENAFREADARRPVFEEDAALVQSHRELQHEQMEGWSDFIDTATEHGVPFKRGDKIAPGHDLYYRDASDHLKEIGPLDKEKIANGLMAVPDNTMVLNKTHIQNLLSEAERQGKVPSGWSRKIVAPWKVAYTVGNISYHVGNEIGNRVLAWMADVGPAAWAQSHSYLRVIRQRNAFEKTPAAARGQEFAATLSKGDRDKLAELELAEKSGALRSGLHQEISNLRGKQPGPARRFGERREMQARIAVWNQARKEGMGPDEAADKVNKFLIDYGNLTRFEKRVRDAGIPFYTFWARNTRLQVSQLAQRPGKAATFQKARADSASAQGEDPKFAAALQYYQQAGAPFIIMLNGAPVLFFAKTPIEQGLSTPSDAVKALGGLIHGDPGQAKELVDGLVSRLGPQKILLESAVNYQSFRHKPISDTLNPGQAGLETAPSWAADLPPILQKSMGVVKDRDGKTYWNAGIDYLANNVVGPYGKTATDLTTPKDAVNQYGQKPWMTAVSAAGLKVSTGDPRYVAVQQAYTAKNKLLAQQARMEKLKTAWKTLTPAEGKIGENRVQTPEYRKILDDIKVQQAIIDGGKEPDPVTMQIPKTRKQEREEYLKERKAYDPKTERQKYLLKRKAQRMLRGG